MKPETVFKYAAFTEYGLQILTTQSLYFASPANFNDPYDCALDVTLAEATPTDLHKFKI